MESKDYVLAVICLHCTCCCASLLLLDQIQAIGRCGNSITKNTAGNGGRALQYKHCFVQLKAPEFSLLTESAFSPAVTLPIIHY